ncbi:SMI1/KNR4 family protein [Rhizobium oryziradicis]|uniref:Knr4/Smi1-like domain-containing protein n=1 Tax=Rhizobium oryziradicis TaxID=1867956 RepID=A0A1Q8ZL24_9HYPH|nr:SMI1/KNR4 family protein [Rhizobium oryziradicis]OLP42440.1 hypothetical protein BJF95_13465 [Rhizobium oryziradicis]
MSLQIPAELNAYLNKPDEMGRAEELITQADLDEFERSQDVKLPSDYKEYCLKYGSRTLQNKQIFCFTTKISFPDRKKKKANIGSISGPPYILEAHDRYINPTYGNSGPRLPEKLYPFTFDSGYGHCLLDLNKDTLGRILYIVIKAKTFGEPGYGWDQVGFVADSFSDFVANLKPDYL